jgi:hypothetical protein
MADQASILIKLEGAEVPAAAAPEPTKLIPPPPPTSSLPTPEIIGPPGELPSLAARLGAVQQDSLENLPSLMARPELLHQPEPLKQGILPPVLEQQGLSLADAMKAHAEAQKAAADKARELTANQKLLADVEKSMAREIDQLEKKPKPPPERGRPGGVNILSELSSLLPKPLRDVATPLVSGAERVAKLAPPTTASAAGGPAAAAEAGAAGGASAAGGPAAAAEAGAAGGASAAIPALVGFAIAVGAAALAAKAFASMMDESVMKYAQYNPALAAAQAQAEVRTIFADMRRAQESEPQLAQYIQARFELQQSIEDLKVKFIQEAGPALSEILKVVVALMPLVELIVTLFRPQLKSLELISKVVQKIFGKMDSEAPPGGPDPLDILNRAIQTLPQR